MRINLGFIFDLFRGVRTVKRDVAETIYEANKEAINTLKLQIRILDTQLSREWGNTND